MTVLAHHRNPLLPGAPPKHLYGTRPSVWRYRKRVLEVGRARGTWGGGDPLFQALFIDIDGNRKTAFGTTPEDALANARYDIDLEDLPSSMKDAVQTLETAIDDYRERVGGPFTRSGVERHIELFIKDPEAHPPYTVPSSKVRAYLQLSEPERTHLIEEVMEGQRRWGLWRQPTTNPVEEYRAWCLDIEPSKGAYGVRAYATPPACDATDLCGDYWVGQAPSREAAARKGRTFVRHVEKTGQLPPVRNPHYDDMGLHLEAGDVFVKVASHRAAKRVEERLGYRPQGHYSFHRKIPAATRHYVLSQKEFDAIKDIRGVERAPFRRTDEWQPTINFLGPRDHLRNPDELESTRTQLEDLGRQIARIENALRHNPAHPAAQQTLSEVTEEYAAIRRELDAGTS